MIDTFLLRAFLFLNVCACPKPLHEAPFSIGHGQRAHEVPAVFTRAVAQTTLDFERAFHCERSISVIESERTMRAGSGAAFIAARGRNANTPDIRASVKRKPNSVA